MLFEVTITIVTSQGSQCNRILDTLKKQLHRSGILVDITCNKNQRQFERYANNNSK